jgi:hypothetical protein
MRVPIVLGDVLDTACLDSANLVGWLSSGWRRAGYRHWAPRSFSFGVGPRRVDFLGSSLRRTTEPKVGTSNLSGRAVKPLQITGFSLDAGAPACQPTIVNLSLWGTERPPAFVAVIRTV